MNGFREKMMRFMAGRRGIDQFSLALYILGFVLYLLALILSLPVLSLLSTAVWIYGLFRGFSRNIAKREAENRWFMGWFGPIAVKIKQAHVRFKNRKIYLYYRCPKCKCWLKLPRNVGEKHVTCGHCGASFTKKA
ncbi:MAG: hypothetical protein II875_01435 [Clostridia bacterium]|jgi:hypothetical protein|nr:hypothetical protein [Clostridia bacterium]